MKKYIYLILFICSVAVAGTIQWGDLTVKGATISEGNLSTNAFLSATTGIASLNGGPLRLHETNANGGSKVTVQTVSNLSADYALTLPPNDGSASQVLTTDGNGVLTWETGGGGVTASSTTTFTNKTIDADGTGNSITNIENADIKAAAAIAVNKLAAVTASRVVTSDVSGFLTTGNVDTTELLLLDGVTGVLTTNAGTQTLTNKTLTSPVVGTTATFTNNASARFFEATGGGSNKITVSAPAALAGDVTFTLPPTNGTNTYVLQTNGSGVTSWVAPSGGGSSVAGLYCKIKWAFASNANWGNASGSYAIPAADTDFPTPTVTTTALGTAAGITCAAPGTKVPTLVTTSLPAGEYHIVTLFPGWGDASLRCSTRLTDGTDTGDASHFGSNNSTAVINPVHNFFDIVYGSTVSKDFSIQLASSSGGANTCFVFNGASSLMDTTIYVYRVR